jgi:seryl-tRNA synthetase
MLDIQLIREHPDRISGALNRRGMESPIEQIASIDAKRRELLTQVESLKAERNRASKEIGKLKDADERERRIEEMREVGDQIDRLDQEVAKVESELHQLMIWVPNLPADSVPDGADESENVLVRSAGEPKSFDFQPKPHWELGPELGVIDFERGVKITGSRFYVLNDDGARLQRALIAWMLSLHQQQGYHERYTPFVVREATVFAAGQLPKFKDNQYRDIEDDLWLVPTAEVPLTGLHMDEILEADQLPLRYTAYTPCFRREKMSAGRDVRGIKRGHQFDKVEMYVYCSPEESEAELEKMVADAESTCEQLGLAYRVLELCTGDLGFAASKTYDIEVWAPGAEEWLEVSSLSNCTDFQARRANARYRPEPGGSTRFVHTLNGSGLGLPRTLIAVLENYQRADGCVEVPEVLRPWMGETKILCPQPAM